MILLSIYLLQSHILLLVQYSLRMEDGALWNSINRQNLVWPKTANGRTQIYWTIPVDTTWKLILRRRTYEPTIHNDIRNCWNIFHQLWLAQSAFDESVLRVVYSHLNFIETFIEQQFLKRYRQWTEHAKLVFNWSRHPLIRT